MCGVRLRAPAGKAVRYHAGQYLMIERDSGEIGVLLASAPHAGRELELHVLAREASARSLIEQLQRNQMARVELPFGDTHLAELPDGPLVLMAAGTGMAQMHSLIEHCRASGFKHPVHLYWGVRLPEDFYEIEHWDQWLHLPNLFLHKVVSDLCGWEGRCGLLHEAVCEDIADLNSVHVYASGSPAMIYGTLDALVNAGMDAHRMRRRLRLRPKALMWELACLRWRLLAEAYLPDTPDPTVGAGLLAKAAWQSTGLDCVHIYCCGNGRLGSA